jgi:hypothetical protein
MLTNRKKDSEFRIFRHYVNVLVGQLEQDAYELHFTKNDFEEGCINDYIRLVKCQALEVYGEVDMEDDEYGTLAHDGYARNYKQALSRFLDIMERFHSIVPVEAGDTLLRFNYDVVELCRKAIYRFNARHDCYVKDGVQAESIFGEDSDEDLPF